MGYSPIANRRVKTMVTKLMEVAIGNVAVEESARKRKGKVDPCWGTCGRLGKMPNIVHKAWRRLFNSPVGAVGRVTG